MPHCSFCLLALEGHKCPLDGCQMIQWIECEWNIYNAYVIVITAFYVSKDTKKLVEINLSSDRFY